MGDGGARRLSGAVMPYSPCRPKYWGESMEIEARRKRTLIMNCDVTCTGPTDLLGLSIYSIRVLLHKRVMVERRCNEILKDCGL